MKLQIAAMAFLWCSREPAAKPAANPQGTASRPAPSAADRAADAKKLFEAALEAASRVAPCTETVRFEVHVPAQSAQVAASGTTVCKANADSKFWSESIAKTATLGPGGAVTLLFDGKQYWLDVRQEGAARRVHRAPRGGLYLLESNAAQGLYGALPPVELLTEMGRAVDWESVESGELDGKRCQQLIGKTKRRDFPVSHVALPEAAVCRLSFIPESKELVACEIADPKNQFRIVQRIGIERAKAPFPDATFRIADADSVEVHDVRPIDPNDELQKRIEEIKEKEPIKEAPASKPKEKG